MTDGNGQNPIYIYSQLMQFGSVLGAEMSGDSNAAHIEYQLQLVDPAQSKTELGTSTFDLASSIYDS